MAHWEMRRFGTHFKNGRFVTPLRFPDVRFDRKKGDPPLKVRWLHIPEVVAAAIPLSLITVALINYFK